MSGIYGIVTSRDGDGVLDAAVAGAWSRPGVAMGAPRGGAGGRDLHFGDGHVAVADARLDNRAELERALGLGGRELPDGALILAAYERWGRNCPMRLLGAFAFAVWDERRQVLFCARDHIGLRPLHFWRGGGELIFASHPDALLATGRPPGTADEIAFVARLVDHHGILKERSPHAEIAKLPPGERLEVFAGNRVSRTTYWTPEPGPPLRLPSRAAYADALRDAVQAAVEAAVRGERRAGAHLSGGLDSSAIAVLGHRTLAREGAGLAHLFSWSPGPVAGACDDERARVSGIAESLGLGVSWTRLTAADLQADFRREAGLDPNETAVYEHLLLEDASARGIDVMLSGWGGDETASFHGHGHSRWLARSGRWVQLLRETRTTSRRRGHRGLRLTRNVAMRMVAAARPRRDDGAVWTDLSHLHPLAAELQRDVADRTRTRLSPQDTQIALLSSGHLTNRIEAWAHAGRPAGVEYRYPMLDRRLIDLCLSFPPEVWVKDGFDRWPFRQAMAPILPAELCWGRAKREPARVSSHLELFMAGCAPDASVVDARARLVALKQARQREALRQRAGEASSRSIASATSSAVQADAGRRRT